MFKVILKCWRCAGKDTRRCCGVSLLCPVDFHRCGLCSCTDPSAGWTPGAAQNITTALWTLEWLCQAMTSSFTLLFSEEGRSLSFPDFYKIDFLLLQTQRVFNCYPQNQSDKIRKPWERNMRGIKAFSKLDLILQNKSLVQHSAKPFRL